MVFFYKADRYTGNLQSSDEGEVFWLPRQQLSEYHLVEDFMDMLKVFESDTQVLLVQGLCNLLTLAIRNVMPVASFSYVLLRLKGYTNPGQAAPWK